MLAYKIGDRDTRPWGHYTVTAVGTTPDGAEFCEKEIVVKPGNILSLQSHEMRGEVWTVRQGTLTALVDGARIEVSAGQTVNVPKGSIHCMANLTDTDCVVHELQEGVCREEDIKRYIDAYGRATESLGQDAAVSVALYQDILQKITAKAG